MANNRRTYAVENAQIVRRNFSGKGSQFNPEGRRNFCLLLTQSDEEKMLQEGWNVKYFTSKDDPSERTPFVQVAVSFDPYPPQIYIISGNKKTLLSESEVNMLDNCDIDTVDLVLQPYHWEMTSGKSGIKAYLKTMYVTLVRDEFADKYDVYDSNDDSGDAPFDA